MTGVIDAELDRNVRTAESRRGELLVSRDFEALERLLSPDLIHVHSTGVRHSRSELMGYIREKIIFLSVERSVLTVIPLAGAALMFGLMSNSMKPITGGDSVYAVSHVTQLWVKSGEDWILRTFQATRAA